MGVITLPENMVTDQQNGIKASSQHVQDNFDTLLNAVNNKLEKDGSIVPTADLSMGSHKITNLASPTADGDATNQGWVNTKLLTKANLASPTFTGTPVAPTPTAGDDSTKIATTEFVNDAITTAIKPVVPVGTILEFGGSTAPTGFLLCDGSAVSRTTYADLFTAIGTSYGPGDGVTTFNLPDQTPTHKIVEFQAPTALNNYAWYRKYDDGWVEQGGRHTGNGTVDLTVEMADTNYTLLITTNNGNNGTQGIGTEDLTTTSFFASRYSGGLGLISWYVSGMSSAGASNQNKTIIKY